MGKLTMKGKNIFLCAVGSLRRPSEASAKRRTASLVPSWVKQTFDLGLELLPMFVSFDPAVPGKSAHQCHMLKMMVEDSDLQQQSDDDDGPKELDVATFDRMQACARLK